MKQKKMHEVQQICPYIDRVWRENAIKTIVDIGAGQGYISRVDTLVNPSVNRCWHPTTATP